MNVLYLDYNNLINYAPLIAIIVTPIIAWGSWVTKRIFVDNGDRKICMKRIEGMLSNIQTKLDDFIKFHSDK